jgi:single-strand DNA-binding protein
MEAKVFATGHLGKDAEVIQFSNGNAVIEFSLATNRYYTDSNGESQQKTTWHSCKRFVREVKSVIDKLVKGTAITISGVLQYEEYTKEVTKTKSVNIKRAYIDVQEFTVH